MRGEGTRGTLTMQARGLNLAGFGGGLAASAFALGLRLDRPVEICCGVAGLPRRSAA